MTSIAVTEKPLSAITAERTAPIYPAPTTAILSKSTANSLGAFSTSFRVTISNCLSTSNILISCYVTHSCTVDNIAMFALYDNTNSQYVSGNSPDGHFSNSVDEGGRVRSSSFQILYDPPSFSSGSLQIELYMKGSGGTGTHYLNTRSQLDAYGRGTSNIILQEISSGVLDANPIVKRTWQTKTNSESGYTAISGDRLFIDTSSGTVTVTLPASPAVGAFVRFVDVAGTFATNNLTIGRNSEKIMRSATDMTVSDSFSAFELVYSGSTHGWMITEI